MKRAVIAVLAIMSFCLVTSLAFAQAGGTKTPQLGSDETPAAKKKAESKAKKKEAKANKAFGGPGSLPVLSGHYAPEGTACAVKKEGEWDPAFMEGEVFYTGPELVKEQVSDSGSKESGAFFWGGIVFGLDHVKKDGNIYVVHGDMISGAGGHPIADDLVVTFIVTVNKNLEIQDSDEDGLPAGKYHFCHE